MSKVLDVSNGDYRVRVQTGGNIILDTQSTYGKVLVIGDLDVQGQLTYIESTNTQVNDNILQLNYGQTGNGISSANNYVSGIEIERGNYSAAQILFNENVQHYDPVTSTEVNGTFVLSTADGKLSGLRVASISNSGTTDFVFDMQGSANVLRVANSLGGYENNINNDNDIINRKYLYNYVAASNGVADVSLIHYPLTGSYNTVARTTNNSIDFLVGAQLKAQVTAGGLNINDVLLSGHTITNVSVNPLVLTATNNTVEVNAVLNLDNQSTDITTPKTTLVGGLPTTTIYTKSAEGPGRTGIYFTNSTAYGSNAYNNDELVSKNRAVLLSILL
jgi:hypothetical protein